MPILDPSILRQFSPLDILSDARLQELATLCFIERVNKGLDPFRLDSGRPAHATYLLSGKLGLQGADGINRTFVAQTDEARFPLDPQHIVIREAIALSAIEIIRVDADLLDIMMTWDHLGEVGDLSRNAKNNSRAYAEPQETRIWLRGKGDFSGMNLKNGLFSKLPAARIEEMLRRMSRVAVVEGQVIVKQGDEGSHYYLIEEGEAQVLRSNASGADEFEVILGPGDTFGEEALAANIRRNATVIMTTNGSLLQLDKLDFIDLLTVPLIKYISLTEAESKLADGAIWLDVRTPSEYKFNHYPGAINLPLLKIRELCSNLNKTDCYITYCQTGRRSSAATFLLSTFGFDVFCLDKK